MAKIQKFFSDSFAQEVKKVFNDCIYNPKMIKGPDGSLDIHIGKCVKFSRITSDNFKLDYDMDIFAIRDNRKKIEEFFEKLKSECQFYEDLKTIFISMDRQCYTYSYDWFFGPSSTKPTDSTKIEGASKKQLKALIKNLDAIQDDLTTQYLYLLSRGYNLWTNMHDDLKMLEDFRKIFPALDNVNDLRGKKCCVYFLKRRSYGLINNLEFIEIQKAVYEKRIYTDIPYIDDKKLLYLVLKDDKLFAITEDKQELEVKISID